MKVCRVCGQSKPLREFPRDWRVGDGHGARCKACRRVWWAQKAKA